MSYDLVERSISELQADMSANRVTSAELVEQYLGRIAAYDQAGLALNSVLYVHANAINDARSLDAERASRGPRGPLHGIPMLVKDNYDTADMPTTGASLGLVGAVPRQDAFQVRKLREAGAVLIGKTNLHELALGLTTHSSLTGQARNPYDPTRTPGGSSGGSGIATAANFAAFTMGTDTSGSIRIPSSHNSIVGLRPSAGLSSRSGIIPFSVTQDTGGPMARTVEDIALILDATVGYDPEDPITAMSKGKIPQTYTAALQPDALQTARIGVLSQLFGNEQEDEEVAGVVRKALVEMEGLGAATVEVAVPELPDLLAASNLLAQELKFCLRDYLGAQQGSWVKSLEELVDAGLLSSTVEFFLVNVFPIHAQPEDYLQSDDYATRRSAREILAARLIRLMDENNLDAIAYPVTRRIAPIIGSNQIGSNAAIAAQSGLPAINVPAGFTEGGFPVGIELLGRAFAEPTLLSLAYSFEQATRHRRPPSLPTPDQADSLLAEALSDETPSVALSGTTTASGRNANPQTSVPFEATVDWRYYDTTRILAYDIRLLEASSATHVGGMYLHHRIAGMNGGVAHVLARSGQARVEGKVVLTEAQAKALLAGELYVSILSKDNPRLGARADLVQSGPAS